MKKGSAAVTAIIAILLLSSFCGTALASAPVLPCEFYGSVVIDGSPAPAGTTIIATINGQERGRIVTTVSGQYGGTGTFDERLKVIPDESDFNAGTPEISFLINDRIAKQEVMYQAGESVNLDLYAGGPAPTHTPTPVPTTVPTTVPPTTTPTTAPPTPVPTTIPPTPVPTYTPSFDVPNLPQAFYGTAFVYGNPVMVGGEIEAKIAGYDITGPNNPVSVETEGIFGGESPFDENIAVQDIPTGTELEFWIKDTNFQRGVQAYVKKEDSSFWSYTLPYEPGQSTKINLIVTSTPPTVGPTPTPTLTFTPTPTYTPAPQPTGEVPGIPHSAYGAVTVYGNPIQPGGFVEARIAGYDVSGPNNPIEVTNAGSFGGESTWSPKLVVQGANVPDGSPVEFWVKDLYYQVYVRSWVRDLSLPGDYSSSIPYHSAAVSNLDIIVQNTIPTATPTLTPVPTETPSPEQSPQMFYGTALVDGELISVGAQVKATVDGLDYYAQNNPITVYETGKYGSADENAAKLTVVGEGIEQGDEIEFWVKDLYYQYWLKAKCKHPLSGSDWQDSYRYTPGSVTQLDLSVDSKSTYGALPSVFQPILDLVYPN